jgi:hypothetical protein
MNPGKQAKLDKANILSEKPSGLLLGLIVLSH